MSSSFPDSPLSETNKELNGAIDNEVANMAREPPSAVPSSSARRVVALDDDSDNEYYVESSTNDSRNNLKKQKNNSKKKSPRSFITLQQSPSKEKLQEQKAAELKKHRESSNKHGKKSTSRLIWIIMARIGTILIPDLLLSLVFGMKNPDVRIAWREKVLLCEIILFMSGAFFFWVEFLPQFICKIPTKTYDATDIRKTDDLIIVNGKVLNISLALKIIDPDLTQTAQEMFIALKPHAGKDASLSFTNLAFLSRTSNSSTTFINPYINKCVASVSQTDAFITSYAETFGFNLTLTGSFTSCPEPTFPGTPFKFEPQTFRCFYSAAARKIAKLIEIGHYRWYAVDVIKNPWDNKPDRFIYDNNVYELSQYLRVTVVKIIPDQARNLTDSSLIQVYPRNGVLPFPSDFTSILIQIAGTDATSKLKSFSDFSTIYKPCMDLLFYAGQLEKAPDLSCTITTPILLGCSIAIYCIVLAKFLMSLQFGLHNYPAYQKDYAILFVPCYSEGRDSLKKTIDSLVNLEYDDHRKLLMVVCDGNLTGAGNAESTPRAVLSILGYNSYEPEPRKYYSLGEKEKKQNRAKVYAGFYYLNMHVVPYIVIVKVGNVLETEKPGNRGKRDSQLILMNFLNRLIKDDTKLTPLDYEIYYCINYLIQVNPKVYEYVLMVDADTEVVEDSLNQMIARMSFDTKTIALCGETKVANQTESFTTMIQIYEYFISHHIGKAFESLFGSVTCLPGCFSLYRIKSQDSKPFLVDSGIIKEYSINEVDTLHLKNLLHLGEDRYLTTLLLKHFPLYRLRFIPFAKCYTIIPSSFNVLLSQRRRWINSTIHNLWELIQLKDLCGFGCCSMKTIIISDLIGTVFMPAALVFFYYTIVKIILYGFSAFAIVIISFMSLFLMHMFIFIAKMEFMYLLWLLIYVLFSMPIFSIVLPLYAFWHFDDFSWGKTRKIEGSATESKDKFALDNDLDYAPIIERTIDEFEKEDPRQNGRAAKPKPGFNSKLAEGAATKFPKNGPNPSQQHHPNGIVNGVAAGTTSLSVSQQRYQEPNSTPALPFQVRYSMVFSEEDKPFEDVQMTEFQSPLSRQSTQRSNNL